jgi:hypothetical protein
MIVAFGPISDIINVAFLKLLLHSLWLLSRIVEQTLVTTMASSLQQRLRQYCERSQEEGEEREGVMVGWGDGMRSWVPPCESPVSLPLLR